MIAGMAIWGGTNQNVIRANPSHDNVVYAAGGHDTIYANGLINTIHGGGGTDTAVFRGRRSWYTISNTATSDGSEVVMTRRGSAATTHVTTLYDIEHIWFAGLRE
jgi:serralysin